MTPRSHIVVIEDDENLGLALADNLGDEGYLVDHFPNLARARAGFDPSRVHLILLDIMLPDGDGYGYCRELRASGHRVPIMMLTARSLEDDIVRGFEAGADDYLTKPYRLRELLARVSALLRRGGAGPAPLESGEPAESDTIEFAGFRLDRRARQLRRSDGLAIELTPKEYGLLVYFTTHRDRALPRTEILTAVWDDTVAVDPRTVDNFVSSLKRKLSWQPDSKFRIQTIRGVGYRMEWH